MTAKNTPRALTEAHSAPTEGEIMPQRIQRKRSKGWRMPAGAVYVGRGSRWGNPFAVQTAPRGMVGAYPMTDRRYAVVDTRPDAPRGNYKLFQTFYDAAKYAAEEFAWWSLDKFTDADLAALAGRDLACWCTSTHPCHADTLLKRANALPAAIEA